MLFSITVTLAKRHSCATKLKAKHLFYDIVYCYRFMAIFTSLRCLVTDDTMYETTTEMQILSTEAILSTQQNTQYPSTYSFYSSSQQTSPHLTNGNEITSTNSQIPETTNAVNAPSLLVPIIGGVSGFIFLLLLAIITIFCLRKK